MLIFATSDKGGTGRSVTGSNLAYRRTLSGDDVCYVDFDFGSPTAGAIFGIGSAMRGAQVNGLHSYFMGTISEPTRINVWSETDRLSLRERPPGAGRLILIPGDAGGSEFPTDREKVRLCVSLLQQLESEFEICIVDLSAGRSYATKMVLEATADPKLRSVKCRWLVFHRWTKQHIVAASGLVFDNRGIIDAGVKLGHDRQVLIDSIRFVRTAVVDPEAEELAGLPAEQITWLRTCNHALSELARTSGVGRTAMIGQIPLDPVLQWREQLISERDVLVRKIANQRTADALDELAAKLTDDAAWDAL